MSKTISAIYIFYTEKRQNEGEDINRKVLMKKVVCVCVGIHVETKLTKIILEITNYSALILLSY